MSLHRHPSCLDLVWMTDPLESGGAKVGFWSAGQFSGPVSSGTEPSLLRPCCWPPFMCRTHNRDTWGRRSAECDAMQTTSPSVFRLDWARLACDFGRQRIHGYTAWSDSRQTAAQHGESHRPCCFLASLGACFGCRWRHGSFPMNAAEEGGLCSSFPRPPSGYFPKTRFTRLSVSGRVDEAGKRVAGPGELSPCGLVPVFPTNLTR